MSAKGSKSRKLLFVVIGVWVGVCLIALLVVGLAFSGALPFMPTGLLGSEAAGAGINIDELAPDFALQNPAGETIRLSDLKGKAVVINFWATWCGPCVREMSTLQKYQDKYPAFVLLGVDEKESAEEVKAFMQKMKLTYQVLLDENAEVSALFQVMIMPTTYFIDEAGVVRARHFGYMGEEQFEFYLGSLGVIVK